MKIFKNVLSSNTLSIINRELMNNLNSNEADLDNKVWTCSNFKWGRDVLVNISGTTMVSLVSPGLVQLILEDVEGLLPKINHTRMQYFVWTPNAGISCHTDALYKFGATIYLNDSWNIDDGGIFLYQHDGDDWRAHIPTFNTMTYNDTRSKHMVTPVSPFAKHNRYTIQIFGDLVNE